jgi:hypothetical protein
MEFGKLCPYTQEINTDKSTLFEPEEGEDIQPGPGIHLAGPF